MIIPSKNLRKELYQYPELEVNEKDYVYEQGNQTEALYLVEKGVIKTCMIDKNGKELITNLCKSDDIFWRSIT
jgi:CRP-like cAMP-binding protein